MIYRARIYFIITLFVSLLFSCHIYHISVPKNKKIFHFDMVEIGGIKQAIMIKGDCIDNPVMVFLHGGPGFPLFPFEPTEETMKELEKEYTVVYWEQRGTGKSFSNRLSSKSMNIDQFISDTKTVIEYSLKFTGDKKVFLWGHSWGSNIGALFAAKYPEYLHAYISTGQSVRPIRSERLSYEFVYDHAIKTNNKRALRQLTKIDTVTTNYTLEDALLVRKWVYRFGGVVRTAGEDHLYISNNEIFTILTSSEYSIIERINMALYPYYSARRLWDELKDINLIEQAPKIDAPVYFLIGRYDFIVSHVLAEKYFNLLEAPSGKELIWFENSAHRPFSEEKEKFLDVLINKIMSEVLPNKQLHSH